MPNSLRKLFTKTHHFHSESKIKVIVPSKETRLESQKILSHLTLCQKWSNNEAKDRTELVRYRESEIFKTQRLLIIIRKFNRRKITIFSMNFTLESKAKYKDKDQVRKNHIKPLSALDLDLNRQAL